METLSLTAYAKLRGVSHVAVSKAIATGRLSASVVRDARGVPKIGDVELADREWAASTRTRIDHQPAATAADGLPMVARTPGGPAAVAALDPAARYGIDDLPDYQTSRAKREAAAARRESAQADMAELDLAERRSELVSVADARADVIDSFAIVRTRLLGIPSRVAQRLPALAAQVVPVLDELLRDALEELAVDGDGAE